MAARIPSVPPALPLTRDLDAALTTWSTSQRTVIGLSADFADSGEWMADAALSAAHWIAGVADIEVCTAREWIRVGRRLRSLTVITIGSSNGCSTPTRWPTCCTVERET